jgi:hypothetical protein
MQTNIFAEGGMYNLPFVSALFSTRGAIFVFAGAVLLFFLIHSLIFIYHWTKYGIEKRVTALAFGVYFVVSLPLLVIFAYATVSFI